MMILLDTDHMTVLTDRRDKNHDKLLNKLASVEISLPIVAIEEQMKGALGLIHRYREVERQLWAYARLHEIINAIKVTEILPFDASCLEYYQEFVTIRPRLGTQDMKIAAITKFHNALLLSNNLKDFKRIPGLKVESWIV